MGRSAFLIQSTAALTADPAAAAPSPDPDRAMELDHGEAGPATQWPSPVASSGTSAGVTPATARSKRKRVSIIEPGEIEWPDVGQRTEDQEGQQKRRAFEDAFEELYQGGQLQVG